MYAILSLLGLWVKVSYAYLQLMHFLKVIFCDELVAFVFNLIIVLPSRSCDSQG